MLAATRDLDMLTLLGLPVSVEGNVYNCAAAICRGQVLALIPKANLPEYGEFYERRQFTPAPEGRLHARIAGADVPLDRRVILRCAELPELAVGVEICEDL